MNDLDLYNTVLSKNITHVKKIKKLNKITNLNYIKIYHLNIRSYSKNHLELWSFLDTFNFKFDILILSETWNNFVTSHYYSNYYTAIYKINDKNKSGGVAIFIKTKLFINEINLSFLPLNDDIDIVGCTYKYDENIWNIFGIYSHNLNTSKKLDNMIQLIDKNYNLSNNI